MAEPATTIPNDRLCANNIMPVLKHPGAACWQPFILAFTKLKGSFSSQAIGQDKCLLASIATSPLPGASGYPICRFCRMEHQSISLVLSGFRLDWWSSFAERLLRTMVASALRFLRAETSTLWSNSSATWHKV